MPLRDYSDQNSALKAKEGGIATGSLRDCYHLDVGPKQGKWKLLCKQDAFAKSAAQRRLSWEYFVSCESNCLLFLERKEGLRRTKEKRERDEAARRKQEEEAESARHEQARLVEAQQQREERRRFWLGLALSPITLPRYLLRHLTEPFPERVQVFIVIGVFAVLILLIVAWRPELREIVIAWAEAIKSLK